MPFKADHALQLLARARDHGRLGHAYLITGPKEAQHEQFAARVLDLMVGEKHLTLEGWEGQGPSSCDRRANPAASPSAKMAMIPAPSASSKK